MAKTQTYRAFVARPSHVLDLNGELLDGTPVLAGLASEICDLSSYATYLVRNDSSIVTPALRPATAGAVAVTCDNLDPMLLSLRTTNVA